MSSYRADFQALPWQAGMRGLRFKNSSQEGTLLRVVEYTRDMEPHWCAKGHIGYVLEGRFEVRFKGEVVIYGEGDGVFIPTGEDHEHMGRALTDVVRMVLVEMDTMTTGATDKRQLEETASRFDDAFNREDLDAVMGMFHEDAIYDQFNGVVARGKTAIRDALTPQFRGDHGKMRFHREDRLVDAESGRVVMRYRCTHELGGKVYEWRGIDTLLIQGGLVKEKHTYSKAEMPLLDPKPG